MQQQTAAVDVAQKVVSQARAFGCTLDDAGDIGHDKALLLPDRHHAQIGHQRGEVVVCDLGPCRRHHGQQRRLADVREADQTDVREQFELKDDVALNARLTGLGKTRCLTGRGGEVRISPTAVAALGRDERLIVRQVLDDLPGFLVADDRAARHADN